MGCAQSSPSVDHSGSKGAQQRSERAPSAASVRKTGAADSVASEAGRTPVELQADSVPDPAPAAAAQQKQPEEWGLGFHSAPPQAATPASPPAVPPVVHKVSEEWGGGSFVGGSTGAAPAAAAAAAVVHKVSEEWGGGSFVKGSAEAATRAAAAASSPPPPSAPPPAPAAPSVQPEEQPEQPINPQGQADPGSPGNLSMDNPRISTEAIFVGLEGEQGESAWKAAKKRHSMQMARAGDSGSPAAPSKAAKEFHKARQSIEMRRNSMAIEGGGRKSIELGGSRKSLSSPIASAAAKAAAAVAAGGPRKGGRRGSLSVEGPKPAKPSWQAVETGAAAQRTEKSAQKAPHRLSLSSKDQQEAQEVQENPKPQQGEEEEEENNGKNPAEEGDEAKPKSQRGTTSERGIKGEGGEEEGGEEEPANAFANYRRRLSMQGNKQPNKAVEEPRVEGQSKAAREFHSARKSIEAKRMSMEVRGAPLKEATPVQQDPLVGIGQMPWMNASNPPAPAPTPNEEEMFMAQLEERASELSSAPANLRAPLLLLSALPPDTPAPTQMLQRLWSGHISPELGFAGTIRELESYGYVFSAQPNDNSLWVLLDEEVQEQLQEVAGDLLPKMHAALLRGYIEEGSQVADVPDDGYFMHNVTFHLSEAEMDKELRQLLTDPFWLEEKLHSYGVASTVVDFRRYLTNSDAAADDAVMRLYLQAFQMSVGSCLTHIDACVLPAQMMARLHSLKGEHPEVAAWIAEVSDQYSKGKYLGRRTADNQKSARRYRYLRGKGKGTSTNTSNSHVEGSTMGSGTYDLSMNMKTSIPSRLSTESCGSDVGGALIRCLAPMTPTLEQAGSGSRMALRGHSGALTCMELSPDAMDLVTCSADGSTCLWDMEIGDCVLLLEGSSHVSCVGLSLNAGLVLTGTKEGTVQVWDLDGGTCKKTLRPHRTEVTCLKVAPNGSLLVSGSASGSVGVWALASDKIMHHMLGHTAQVLCMDVLFSVEWTEDHCQTLTGSADFTARLWNLRSGKCRAVLEGHTGWVRSVCLTPDGEVAVTGSNDCTVRVWECHSGECFNTLTGHGGPVNAVQIHGDYIASASDDQCVKIWNMDSGDCLHSLNQHAGWLNTVALKGSTCIAAGSEGTVCVWNIDSGTLLAVLEGHSDEVLKCDISPDENTAVTISADSSARIWDIPAACREYNRDVTIQRHAGSVQKLAVCNGGVVVSAGQDGRAFAWNVADGSCEGAMDAHRAAIKWLCTVGDGSEVITASGDRNICTWRVVADGSAQTELVRSMPIERGARVKSFSCSSDGKMGAIVLFDSSCGVWDLVSGEIINMLQRRGDRDKEFVHSGGINGVVLSYDGSIAVTYSKDCTARVWDVTEGCSKLVLSGHTEDVVAAALATEKSAVVTASYDGTARVWDLLSGECTAMLTGHGRDVHGVEMSPDGGIVVTLAGESAKVWETASGSPLYTLNAGAAMEGDESGISPIAAFDSQGIFMLTAVEERLNVWELKSGQLVFVFVADCAITCAAFSGDSSSDTLVAGDVNGNVHFVKIPISRPTSMTWGPRRISRA